MAAPKKSILKEAGQEKGNGSLPEFTREQELSALRDMLLIRRFEEKAGQLYGMGAIGGFCQRDTAITGICWQPAWKPRA